MPHRWLRTKFEGPQELQNRVEPFYILIGLRDDGQKFEARLFTNGTNRAAIARELRAKLETFIKDPALPPSKDEDGYEWSNQIPPDSYKGQPGWIEEAS